MKRATAILFIFVFSFSLFIPDIANAMPAKYKIYHVAIMNLQGEGELDADDAMLLTSELHRRMGEINFIQAVSLQATSNILTQNQLTADFCLNLNCALQAGQVLEVDLIVYGMIHKVGDLFACDIRVANVASRKLVGIARYNFEGDLGTIMDQMKNVARKLVGLKTDPNMPIAKRSVTDAQRSRNTSPGSTPSRTGATSPGLGTTEWEPEESATTPWKDDDWSFLDTEESSSTQKETNTQPASTRQPRGEEISTDDSFNNYNAGNDSDDVFGNPEILTDEKKSRQRKRDESGGQSFKKWAAYGLLGAGLGAGAVLAIKGLSGDDGGGGAEGDLPSPPVFIGDEQ